MSDSKKQSIETTTLIVPLLPLRDLVVFPQMVVPFFVGREKSIAAIESAMKHKVNILLCAQRDSVDDEPGVNDLYQIGTLSSISQLVKLPDGTLKILVEGLKRAHILSQTEEGQFLQVEAEELRIIEEDTIEIQALIRSTKESFENYIKLNKRIPPEVLIPVENADKAGQLSDIIATHLNLKVEERQALLEIVDSNLRLQQVYELLENELDILKMERRIRGRVKKQLEKGQREYYLNEQIAAIQKELGERDEFKIEINEIEENIKNAKMSKEATEKAQSEMRKLKSMPPMSPEATVIRNYLDVLTELPWNERTHDNLDIIHAKEILDEDHYGLEKIKERIIEYIAVQNLNKSKNAPIICFVGPPGVGKTSLGNSIARALEKKYHRISLGGLRDEAEIRGHRKTYVGAMPGKILSALKKVNSKNPLIVLDELDKMGADFRGDPASAMLEVLDPEQNHTFSDHYLEVAFDLSEVMFIATANSLANVPQPLIDRMEIIELSSYLEVEKLNIVKQHLLPKQLEKHGLKNKKLTIEDSAIIELINFYTYEAGVRNINREIAKLCRKCAKRFLEQNNDEPIVISDKDISGMFGPRIHTHGLIEKTDQVGMTNGLCWTPVGGDTLNIEVSIVHGQGKLTITGKLGDVMQESAQAAYSYVRSRAKQLGLPKDFYKNIDVHIHVPEGATPKDGPSAGIAIASSITSALTNRFVKKDVAMTGEITLRGNVLAIGGLKEKLIAAHKAGFKTVIIPDENTKDLHDVPQEVLDALKIVPVLHVDEVLRIALVLEAKDPLLKEFGEIKQEFDNLNLMKQKNQTTRTRKH